MIKVEEIKEVYNFEPKYTFSQLEQNLPKGFEAKIQDGSLYKAVRRLTDKVYPTEENSSKRNGSTSICRSNGGVILFSCRWE